MKTTDRISSMILLIMLSSLMFLTNCSNDDENVVNLTNQEKVMLIQMREEEKLARDVYDYLYAKYELSVFDNISSSEQSHMDKVLDLLNQNSIPDPALANPGEFTSTVLQDLYDNLILQGNLSEVEALKVGATIEDVDIYDLEEFITQTENQQILSVFDKLNCGSRNHMRSFYNQLSNYGVDYNVQFITSAKLAEILDDSHESCGSY